MARTIVLLTGNEDFFVLRQVLGAHAPEVEVIHAPGLPGLRAAAAEAGAEARLIAYLSSVIVPADVLAAFALGAYNFHPGTPDYPGVAPESFAAYDRAKTFGATLHVMDAVIDAGPIVAVERLPVLGNAATRPAYAKVARQALMLLLARLGKDLASPAPLPPDPALSWTGTAHTVKDYNAMCRFSPDITREEMAHRLACFGPPGPVEFFVELHGGKFVLEAPGGLMGHLDQPANDLVLGWIRDANAPERRLEVKLVVDGDREFFLIADRFRPDVRDAGYGDGSSGFEWPVPPEYRDGLPHRIEATAKGQPVPGSPRLLVFPRPEATEEEPGLAADTAK